MVWELVQQADGSMRQCSEIRHWKDDLYMANCAVIGLDKGTPTDPKFVLKPLFQYHIFPMIAELVGLDGWFEWYTMIIQGNNYWPHSEAYFLTYVLGNCVLKGYHWEPQVHQILHMNNLDLSVFPEILKCHTAMGWKQGGLCVLTGDKIWETAHHVWEAFPSSKIISEFPSALNCC